MKKALSLILVLCVVISALSLTAAAAEKDRAATDAFYAKKLAYDVDGDGSVSLDDVRFALSAAAGVIDADETAAADIDGDGEATTLDALAVLKIECGIDTSWYTEEEVVNYLASELNWVKTARPGFTRTATDVSTSNKITTNISTGSEKLDDFIGNLLGSLIVEDMEYNKFIEQNKKLFTEPFLGTTFKTEDEYNEMLAEANNAYKPQTVKKEVEKANTKHYSQFPIDGKAYACRLGSDNELTEYKKITFKENSNGTATITLTMKDYTYPDGSYPYKNLTTIPYGQAFNLPALKDIETMNLKSGKIVCVIDTKTGGIKTVDYSYTYNITATISEVLNSGSFDITLNITKNTNTKHTEHYDINPVTE